MVFVHKNIASNPMPLFSPPLASRGVPATGMSHAAFFSWDTDRLVSLVWKGFH